MCGGRGEGAARAIVSVDLPLRGATVTLAVTLAVFVAGTVTVAVAVPKCPEAAHRRGHAVCIHVATKRHHAGADGVRVARAQAHHRLLREDDG